MVTGHPFKGSIVLSQGQLLHPDMKRFNIPDASLFAPARPNALVTGAGVAAATAAAVPSFGEFFSSYFGRRSFNVSQGKCSQVMEGLKRCYENNQSNDPVEACQYYIQGFERMSCAV